MGIGTIMYYLLWPAIIVILLTLWFFRGIALVMEVGLEYARGLHDDIKNI